MNKYIYTDGSCHPNPGGPGGWSLVEVNGSEVTIVYGHSPSTTNNRMEIKGVLEALKRCEPNECVAIYSDSQYVVNGVTRWMWSWAKKKWADVKNVELWKQVIKEKFSRPMVDVIWVKGHSSNKWNNLADSFASRAREKKISGCEVYDIDLF